MNKLIVLLVLLTAILVAGCADNTEQIIDEPEVIEDEVSEPAEAEDDGTTNADTEKAMGATVEVMIEDLDHENESVRFSAMDALVDIGDEKTVESLMQVVQNENKTIEMRKNAIVTLGKISDNSTTNLLLSISMNEAENKYLRMDSILALGDVGDEDALESLRGLSYGEDGLILYHAAYALNQLNGTYEVYGTYGKLPYPLTEEQRSYRNNVHEIVFNQNRDEFPIVNNVTSISTGYVSKTGYIEVMTDTNPGISSMDEIYQFYNNEAEKRGVYQVPVRFVHGGVMSFA